MKLFCLYLLTFKLAKSLHGLSFDSDQWYTVKPVLVATSIKQATCVKQSHIQFPKVKNTLKCTSIKQAPALSKQILIIP